MVSSFRSKPLAKTTLATLFLLVAFCAGARAQSSDPFHPTPVFTGEVSAHILPRDVGDARRTRHFYTFTGREGDIVVNVESTNLNGDVDLYTATSFRPLTKITLYGGTATRATKSVYLRQDEQLVLRVEARAVGDAEGSYRITFGGSFAAAPAELAGAPESPVLPEPKLEERRGTRPVTATGARIDVPVAEVAPKEVTKTETTETEGERERTESSDRTRTETNRSTRRGRGSARARTGRRSNRGAPAESAEEGARAVSEKKSEEASEKKSESESAERASSTKGDSVVKAEKSSTPGTSARPARRESRRGRRGTRTERARAPERAREPEPTAREPQPAPSQRLIIVTKDGQTIEHDMSTVRRVTVENNQVVVSTRDGKTTRRPLADVLKMSIEP